MTKSAQGFSLIELMIAVVIVAILAAVAIPSYQEHIQKGKRADGKAFLLDIASRQERFYTQFSSYTSVLKRPASCSGPACGLGLSVNTSPDKYYTVSLSATPSGCSTAGTLCTGFSATATPSGWSDDKCGALTYNHTASKSAAGPQPADYCWR